MICKKCGKKEYLKKGNFYCPCDDEVDLLDKKESLRVVDIQISKMKTVLEKRLRDFDKKRLILWIIDKREQASAPFFESTPKIKLDEFLSMSYLIKKVMDIPNSEMGNVEADDENTSELIRIFAFFLDFSSRKHYIEEDFAIYCKKKKVGKNMLLNYFLLFDDSWKYILDSYSEHLIMSSSQGKDYFKEHEKEYEEVFSKPLEPEIFTPKETIENIFDGLMTFWVALQKNKVYGEVFNLDYLKGVGISPDKILDIIKNEFKHSDNMIHQSNEATIISIIKRYFPRYREKIIYKKLVFSEYNKNVFPLFVELDNKIYTSRSFIRLMCVFFYPIFYKNLFDKVLREKGKEFEGIEIPKKFKQQKFNYKENIQDNPKKPNLEIDGLAWKKNKLYIIEAKVWDIRPFFEHRNLHEDRERDLKGVVDGIEYSTKIVNGNKKVKTKPKPSLLKKIEYVKENLDSLCGKNHSIKEIKGIVITRSIPIIKDYNGVDFIGCSEIDKL